MANLKIETLKPLHNMANLKIDWFGRSLSHRADKTSNTYAKVNSITGKTFLDLSKI